MLFNYQGKPQRLLRMFKLFRGMAPRLRQYRTRYGWTIALASLFYTAICAMVLFRADASSASLFWFVSLSGAAYLLWAWAFSGVFQRYPCNRKTTAGRVMTAIVLLVLALFGLTAASEGWPTLLEQLPAASATPHLWAIWGLAGVGVFLASRWIVWLRLRHEMIQEYELDFLYKLLPPLLRDLPPETACALSCNPFTPMWSEQFSTESRGMRRLDIYDDVLLDFKAKLDQDATLALQTVYRRVDKYKSTSKKTKYKGSKHRVAMVCRFQHPAFARPGVAKRLDPFCEGLKKQHRGYAMAVRRDLRTGKITVVWRLQFSGQRELGAKDLPDADTVLATVRDLSAFAIQLERVQKPA